METSGKAQVMELIESWEWMWEMNVRYISSPVYQVTKRVNDNITILIYKSKIHLPSSISKLVFLKKKKKKIACMECSVWMHS